MLLASCGKNDPIPMFVGTYTDQGSDGIYSFSFDQETGKAKAQHSAKISNPSYLVIAPNDSFMYCVSENKGDEAIINAYRTTRATLLRTPETSTLPTTLREASELLELKEMQVSLTTKRS